MADNGNTKTITVRLPVELFERVEEARGGVPREVWARDAFTSAVALSEAVRLPNEEIQRRNIARASVQVKRSVTPIPRGKGK